MKWGETRGCSGRGVLEQHPPFQSLAEQAHTNRAPRRRDSPAIARQTTIPSNATADTGIMMLNSQERVPLWKKTPGRSRSKLAVPAPATPTADRVKASFFLHSTVARSGSPSRTPRPVFHAVRSTSIHLQVREGWKVFQSHSKMDPRLRTTTAAPHRWAVGETLQKSTSFSRPNMVKAQTAGSGQNRAE